MAATAERFGQRPSSLLGISPSEDWLAYCVDEALHVLQAGHDARDDRWHDRFRKRGGDDAADLYEKAMMDPRSDKPLSQAEMESLRYAAEHSGMIHGRDD